MEKNRYGHILTENFQEAVGAWIKNYSNNIAIIEGERKITYRELGNLIIRCRKFFFEQGVKKGDNIAVHMGNHSEFIMVFLSLVTMGAVPILILSAQKKNEVRGIVRVATPKLYIYDAAVSVLGSLVAEGNKELKGIEKTIFTSMLESSEVEKTKEETYKEQIVPEDLALLLLSGGTTGIPKLIPRTHGDYLYNVKRITERLKLTQESVFLSVLPMAHNFALGNPGILGTLCSGGTVVICNDIAAMEIFSLIEETKVTFTAFVPSILKMCLEYRILDDGDDISSLQQVLVGGAMLPEETARQVDLVLGGKLIQVFGTAEGLICTNSMDDSYETRVSCQGQPISEYDEIKIIDNDGKEVAQGEIGELIVKGPYTIQEYYRLLDNDKYFNEEGFYLSGDKVRKLEDGNLKVVGRVKEQINRAGEKIMPSELEELIIKHPDIMDCAVIGIEDEMLGNKICVYAVARKNIILDATTEYQLREIAGVRGSDPAYIIYTSGTTGKPKGVVISHEAAMNTIYDVIERFSLNRETVILGLSNLAFDLSVFDIFGCFQVGGTLVLPDDELKKNPKHILDLIIINRVTVLNAVPAQMKMLDSYMDNAGILEISWVKLIIMSGDWIPVGLPENLFKKFTNAIVVSMGGATECAIWSIFHIIPRGYEKKNSIPYGKPLSNQKFYILNAGMEDCPDGVSGDIYIAGKGLAKEYFKDKEMTDQKFIFLPRIGERIYKTGDVGQYDEAGIIEFLGRSDNQVKVRGHRIELTEIDSILSENKELDDVVSIIVGDAQEDRRIVTVAVPKQAEVATEDTSQEIANIKNKEEELTKEVNKELLSEWVHAANKVVLSDIFLALYGKGVFTDSNRLYTYEEIVKTLNIPNKLYKLMHRWLTVLCNEKIVVHRDGGYCVNLFIAEQYKNNKKLWDEMYSIEGRLHYSQKLLDYLKTSSDVLPELMAGKEDPLNLLFPKGEMDVAMAAYHDNIINRIMNGLAKEEIEFLALDNRRTPIRILEVGAGVGGTSVDVIPSLDGTGAEYYFTDLSAFFLNNAREKFSGYEWVKYNIFDINKDIMEQTIAPFSVDIILAANVLHNAKNIHYVLENLKKLLKPNGTIIILEETLEAYTLLTSMEFKDGLTGFTDERAENNQTFFKREQWEGVFKEHKADIVYQFPEKGTPLEMAGQTIYVVRFKENYICPDKNNMLDELERRIPEYMIPSVITFLPRLPQTSNDKIDRGRISKWISASAEENKKVDVAELPQNDLEEQIARIWCKELNIERIGRNDNFYLSGGDSLLIAQVIARMRETIEAAKRWSWDDLLKEMMKTPTIRGVAKILSNQAGENEQDKSLVIIKEAAESSEKKVTVVFHAGTGTLTPYNSLIAYITERSQENEAVMGFTFGDEAEYLAIPTDKIFENLGKKYGRILSELGFTEYTLIGHCVGGLIALETAHYLKDKGKNVSSVTLLSTSIPHKKEETVLADLDMKIFETAVQTSLYNELLLERTFASLIDADIKKAGHQVDNDTLQQVIEYLIFNNGGNITVQALCSLTGKFAEVGAEFQRLHSMSATERMNDLYTTIERPNGQLMEHQRKMLNVLFRVFAQNFRCVSSYIPKVYTGKMRVFDCESAIANFFPSLFSEDKKTWEQYAQGEFLFDTMKGDHISCMNSPYIEENVKKILDL